MGLKVGGTTISKTGGIKEINDQRKPGEILADFLNEKTKDAGTLINGILLQKGKISFSTETNTPLEINGVSIKEGEIGLDKINEKNPGKGIIIDGMLFKDNSIRCNSISENTKDSGVKVAGVLLKDKNINSDIIYLNEIYLGKPNNDGSWKISIDNGTLKFFKYEKGKYSEKNIVE